MEKNCFLDLLTFSITMRLHLFDFFIHLFLDEWKVRKVVFEIVQPLLHPVTTAQDPYSSGKFLGQNLGRRNVLKASCKLDRVLNTHLMV